MNDNDTLKSMINLRDVVAAELPYAAKYRSHKNDGYCCPFHDDKTPSFAVYDTTWKCFGACNESGDVISFIMKRHDLTFAGAKTYIQQRYLSGAVLPTRNQSNTRAQNITVGNFAPPSEPPDSEWQRKANAIVKLAKENLWQRDFGAKARAYLFNRGFKPETLMFHDIGYIPGSPTEWLNIEGLKVPCGITIPWYAAGVIWAIKVRRAAGDPKYQQVGGGNAKGALYLVDEIKPGLPVLIDEGEFNALSVWQECREVVSPIAIGSTGNAQIHPRWYGHIRRAPSVLARMDSGSGDAALEKLKAISPTVMGVQVPVGYKDPNEVLIKNPDLLRDWIEIQFWDGEVAL